MVDWNEVQGLNEFKCLGSIQHLVPLPLPIIEHPIKRDYVLKPFSFFTNMISNRICLLKKRSGNSFEMMSFEPSRTFLNLAKFIFYSRCKHCLTIWWPLLDTRNSHALELGKLYWTKKKIQKNVIFIGKNQLFWRKHLNMC